MLRDKEEDMKDQAASAPRRGTMDLPPPESFSMPGPGQPSNIATIITEDRTSIRNTARMASSRSLSVASGISSTSSYSLGRQMQMDSASSQGGDTSDNQSGAVHDYPLITVEVITDHTNESVPADMTDAGDVQNGFTLPAGAIELDLLDCDAIPALIAGVIRGTNVTEFLERLEVLAYTGTQLDFMFC